MDIEHKAVSLVFGETDNISERPITVNLVRNITCDETFDSRYLVINNELKYSSMLYDEVEKMTMYNNTCSNCGKDFTALSEDELLCGECRKMQNACAEQQKQMDLNPTEEIGIDGGRLYQFEDAYRDEFNEQERRDKFAKRMRIAIYAVGVVIMVASIAVILFTHE